jgi:FKBP-type peptidyl-prolyl cis-trans isomerase
MINFQSKKWLCTIIPLLGVIFIFSCREKPKTYSGYSKQQDFYYKLLALGDEAKKTNPSQYLWVQASCRTLSDSVFWNTRHNSNETFFITKDSPGFLKHVYGFSVGDSLQYLFPTIKFFKEFFNSPVPFFCEKDSCIKFPLKIMKALNAVQFNSFNDSLHAYTNKQQANEYIQIQNYITKNCKKVNEFTPNAFLEITSPTSLDSVKKGKKTKLFYKGYFLDGTLVDYTPNNRAFEFICGQEGQLLTGLQLGLYKLKKGEKAKIILPSQLAFGSQGSSNGIIPPYTPLVYQVEIVDIK